ncbi:MAG: hypothetical protein U0Q16_23525 [Bryobacteraceae bacterium]
MDPSGAVAEVLAHARQVEPKWINQFLYPLRGPRRDRHLFRVASSLDSMVIGEPQILGQLKESYEVAKNQGTVSGSLDSVLTRAFSVAKRVRTETEIGQSAVSVSYAAVELASADFPSARSRAWVLLIGAGKMSELAARHLVRAGHRRFWSRTGRLSVPERWRNCSAAASSTTPHSRNRWPMWM